MLTHSRASACKTDCIRDDMKMAGAGMWGLPGTEVPLANGSLLGLVLKRLGGADRLEILYLMFWLVLELRRGLALILVIGDGALRQLGWCRDGWYWCRYGWGESRWLVLALKRLALNK